ncbi:tetratricopeptide repeat protein [Thermoleptolyngbya sp. M55_K2018_002]|uniref:tetratricopeptide repeat protein n=1 Tax=Thermoleptolyngbya sp. M55_K2018_002 TaxID=2747808 RepID=UPI0019F36D6B|nr:tetratricopeptide repeat protein [Thermoleptolyngbya sp. M55_K2018_002]HIK40987.1 tetratricopeptide repeat protein [Thermoleptolyngbya sp. M55_K2018_002]
MFDKRNRWIVNGVMAIAAFAFLALLFLPFMTALRSGVASSGASPSATPGASPASQQAELADQARGYELVLQREPDNQTALRGLLETRIRQGDVQGAIEPLEKLARLNPDQSDYTVLLAQARQRVGDREGAAQAYRSILDTQPGNVNALQGFVDLMLEQQRPEAAVSLLQDTLRTADERNRVTPGSVDVTSVQLLLGRVYAQQGRTQEAIALYDQSIEQNALDFRPVLGKALVLQAAGRTEESKPLFDSAAALAPAQYKDQINLLASGGQGQTTASPLESAPADAPAGTTTLPSPTALPAGSPAADSSPSSPSRVTGNP